MSESQEDKTVKLTEERFGVMMQIAKADYESREDRNYLVWREAIRSAYRVWKDEQAKANAQL